MLLPVLDPLQLEPALLQDRHLQQDPQLHQVVFQLQAQGLD